MAARPLTPTSYLVLGLVRTLQPCTSYDMKLLVNISIGMFWSFQHSQLYAEPARLVEDPEELLRNAVAGMTREQLVARPVPGRWSTLEVVCHVADFEPILADRSIVQVSPANTASMRPRTTWPPRTSANGASVRGIPARRSSRASGKASSRRRRCSCAS